jgi:hypothetical protein
LKQGLSSPILMNSQFRINCISFLTLKVSASVFALKRIFANHIQVVFHFVVSENVERTAVHDGNDGFLIVLTSFNGIGIFVRVMSSGIWSRVVCYNFTDATEERTDSVFRFGEKAVQPSSVHFSETSVNFYETARPQIPEDSTIHCHQHENIMKLVRLVMPVNAVMHTEIISLVLNLTFAITWCYLYFISCILDWFQAGFILPDSFQMSTRS